MDRPGQRLGAAIDMDQHGRYASGDLRETLGASEGNHFVRTRDDLGSGLSGGPGLRQSLDNSGVIAAEIHKQVRDSGVYQGFDQSAGAGIGGRLRVGAQFWRRHASNLAQGLERCKGAPAPLRRAAQRAGAEKNLHAIEGMGHSKISAPAGMLKRAKSVWAWAGNGRTKGGSKAVPHRTARPQGL